MSQNKASRLLLEYFGHQRFQYMQWKVISNAVNKSDQLVIMSTGSGKSLCFQLPALLQNSLTLVISPLISLMEDQVRSLRNVHIPATYLTNKMRSKAEAEIINSIRQKHLRLLYTTPEMYKERHAFFKEICNDVGLIAVDEAHCITQWGHDFRSAYRDIGELRSTFPGIPFMALTSTATKHTQKDIIKSLKLKSPEIVIDRLNRKNLYLQVLERSNFKNKSKSISNDLLPLLILNKKGAFVTLVVQLSSIATPKTWLTKSMNFWKVNLSSFRFSLHLVFKDNKVKCASYRADMSRLKRSQVLEDFIEDRISTVVATVAFGMGINKRDVRCVIHYGTPSNVERYFQEIGRAGRDGEPSKCKLFYSKVDFNSHRFNMKSDGEYTEDCKKSVLKNIAKMEEYASAETICRRKLLLSHFGAENVIQKMSTCCDICAEKVRFRSKSVTMISDDVCPPSRSGVAAVIKKRVLSLSVPSYESKAESID